MNPVRITGLFLVSMLVGALTCGFPSRSSRADPPIDEACRGLPSGSTPPGCSASEECFQDFCHNQQCVRRYNAGAPCGPDGQGSCQPGGACREDGQACRQGCIDQFAQCFAACDDDSLCICHCEATQDECIADCDGLRPEPPRVCDDFEGL